MDMRTRLAAWGRWWFVLSVAAVCVACERKPAQPPPPPAPVTVARPVEREVIEWDEYSGRIEAAQKVEVRAQVTGLITEAPFVEGGLVDPVTFFRLRLEPAPVPERAARRRQR